MKILSVDGGGVRGIITATILEEIERKTGKHITELFDAITGTSTGGLIAAAITKPDRRGNNPEYYAKDVVDLYLTQAEKIFAPSLLRKIFTGFGLWGAKYSRSYYDSILEKTFDNVLLSQTLRPLFIPIYSIEKDKPFIASSYLAKNNSNNDFYLKDIVGATGAAPTYFAPKLFKSITNKSSYQGADGGIYANNPELIGITGVYTMNPKLELTDIILVSIGTGCSINNPNVKADNGDIGWLKGRDIISDMIDAESTIAEAAITAMLKNNNHFRLQMNIPEEMSSMDNGNEQHLHSLINIAKDYINQNQQTIDTICALLIK